MAPQNFKHARARVLTRKALQSKKELKIALLAIVAAALLALVFPNPNALAAFLPLPDSSTIDIPTPEGDTAVEKFDNLLGPIARNLRIIIGGIAVLLILVSGITMLFQADNEDNVKTQRRSLSYGIFGLMLISIAGPVAEVFDYRQGNLLADSESLVERAGLFDDTTHLIVTFMKYLLGSLAALFFIRAGATMISSSSNEDDISRERKNLALGASGLLLVIVSDLIVRNIFFDAKYNDVTSETVIAINQNEFISQLVGFTNLVVTFVGPIMLLGLVIAAVLYVAAAGNDERTELAKKILVNSVLGILIIYGSFALVSMMIAGRF